MLYYKGNGVERSREKAIEFMTEAAASGLPLSLIKLAKWSKNQDQLRKAYEIIAKEQPNFDLNTFAPKMNVYADKQKKALHDSNAYEDSPFSANSFPVLYYVEDAWNGALNFDEIVPTRGLHVQIFQLHNTYESRERLAQVIASYEAKATAQDASAKDLFSYGCTFLTHSIVRASNHVRAYKFIKRAAKLDYAPAQFVLGQMYRQGIGVKSNDKKASRYSERATSQRFCPREGFFKGFVYINDMSIFNY